MNIKKEKALLESLFFLLPISNTINVAKVAIKME